MKRNGNFPIGDFKQAKELKFVGYVRFDSRWAYNGCRMLRLENDQMLVDLFPELGGKIYRLIHKPRDRDVLWQHPRILPSRLFPGAPFDDTWCGGWDELFPSDAREEYQGETFPDHGEYWTAPFEWDVVEKATAITLHLVAEGTVTPTRMERWITLEPAATVLRFRHRLTHLGGHGFDFLWKLHPALAVKPGEEILVPAARGEIATPGCGRLAEAAVAFDWPHVPGRDGRLHDFSRVPQENRYPGYEMVYLTDLHDGWCAVWDREAQFGFGLAFDSVRFNNVWLFQTFGGWRGLHCVVLEPSTTWPCALREAATRRTIAHLAAGEVLETATTAVILSGCRRVGGISIDGAVFEGLNE